jgi:hypothetical protein
LTGIGIPLVEGEIRATEAVCAVPPKVAVTIAVSPVVMEPAEAVKAALVAPAATVTVGSTVRSPVSLERATSAPDGPAACDSLTVHVDEEAELRIPGEQEIDVTAGAAGAVRVNDAD